MRAFAFTFDSFVAFILAISLLYGLSIFVSLPKGYYQEFEQTYILAKDTATMLRYAEDTSGNSYSDLVAEAFVGGSPDAGSVCLDIRDNIPSQYAFVLQYYDNLTNDWKDMSTGSECNSESVGHYTCDDYRKAKAAAPIIITAYSVTPNSTIMQYGYNECNGEYTPCAAPGSTFIEGEIEVQLLRLIVCV